MALPHAEPWPVPLTPLPLLSVVHHQAWPLTWAVNHVVKLSGNGTASQALTDDNKHQSMKEQAAGRYNCYQNIGFYLLNDFTMTVFLPVIGDWQRVLWMGAKAEEAGWERSTRRVGLGGPAHRWLWETDVPTELFSVDPANSGEQASYCRVCVFQSFPSIELGSKKKKKESETSSWREAKAWRAHFDLCWSLFLKVFFMCIQIVMGSYLTFASSGFRSH